MEHEYGHEFKNSEVRESAVAHFGDLFNGLIQYRSGHIYEDIISRHNAVVWCGDFYRVFAPKIPRDYIPRYLENQGRPWVEWKTWDRIREDLSRRYGGSVSLDNSIHINGDFHEALGLFAPGIWRERGPDGGIMIPWGIRGGWYEYEGRTLRWGYKDIDEIGPVQRRTLDLSASALDFPSLFVNEDALCNSCANIPIARLLLCSHEKYQFSRRVSEMANTAKFCELCSLVLPSIQQLGSSDMRDISMIVQPQPLTTEGNVSLYTPKLCISSGPGTVERSHNTEFPILSQAGSQFQFLLLNEWLRICDEEHSHPKSFSAELPTRVVDVGPSEDGNNLRLYVPKTGEQGTYIALSHCWGEKKPLHANTGNLEALCKGITFAQLPQTFQDAVLVTRGLGIQYLWIDSLCIIQDSKDDWHKESARMEKVFTSAYCTIAATSANNCEEGFLRRSATKSVKLRNTRTCAPQYAYVTDVSADFDREVENGVLNQRAWVLQERALSRRTIHFSAAQAYWECGSCFRSETCNPIAKPLNPLASSEYPVTYSHSLSNIDASLIGEVFAKYSKLALTRKTDRPTAIVGLESRLAIFYRTPSVYGILTKSLCKSLLWTRAGNAPLGEIDFKKAAVRPVPSWSWMAYEGPIRYWTFPEADIRWNKDVRLAVPGDFVAIRKLRFMLAAPLTRFARGCCIERAQQEDSTNYKVRYGQSRLVGWLRFDGRYDANSQELRCVILALGAADKDEFYSAAKDEILVSGFFFYLLLVARKKPLEAGLSTETETYRRLGVGVIQKDHICWMKPKHCVCII